MKLKNLPIFIILFSVITFSSCEQKTKDEKVDTYLEKAEDAENNSIFNDAIEYNDAIVGIQTKVMVEVLNMGNYDNVSDMKEQLVLIQIELKSTLIISPILSLLETDWGVNEIFSWSPIIWS